MNSQTLPRLNFDVLLEVAMHLPDRISLLSFMGTSKLYHQEASIIHKLLQIPYVAEGDLPFVKFLSFLINHPPDAPRLPHLRSLTFPSCYGISTIEEEELLLPVLRKATQLTSLNLQSAGVLARPQVYSTVTTLTTLKTLQLSQFHPFDALHLFWTLKSSVELFQLDDTAKVFDPLLLGAAPLPVLTVQSFHGHLRELRVDAAALKGLSKHTFHCVEVLSVESLAVKSGRTPVISTAQLLKSFPALQAFDCGDLPSEHETWPFIHNINDLRSSNAGFLRQAGALEWPNLRSVKGCDAFLYFLAIPQHVPRVEITSIWTGMPSNTMRTILEDMRPCEISLRLFTELSNPYQRMEARNAPLFRLTQVNAYLMANCDVRSVCLRIPATDFQPPGRLPNGKRPSPRTVDGLARNLADAAACCEGRSTSLKNIVIEKEGVCKSYFKLSEAEPGDFWLEAIDDFDEKGLEWM